MTPIRDRTIGHYLDALGSSDPAPGGGSVAGVVGALAAGLGQMVVSLTIKNEPHPTLQTESERLQTAIASLLEFAEHDEKAYGGYVAASRLPRATQEEKSARRTAMQAALINAAEVPLGIASAAVDVLRSLRPIAENGTLHALSDAAIATSLAEASVIAALANVRVNVPLIKDETMAASFAGRATTIETEAASLADNLRAILASR